MQGHGELALLGVPSCVFRVTSFLFKKKCMFGRIKGARERERKEGENAGERLVTSHPLPWVNS